MYDGGAVHGHLGLVERRGDPFEHGRMGRNDEEASALYPNRGRRHVRGKAADRVQAAAEDGSAVALDCAPGRGAVKRSVASAKELEFAVGRGGAGHLA